LARSALANKPLSDLEAANISGWIRENIDRVITEKDLEALRTLRTPSVDEKAQKLLRYLAGKNPIPGEQFLVLQEKKESHGPFIKEARTFDANELLATAWATAWRELEYLLQTYLVDTVGHLLRTRSIAEGTMFRIAPMGWKHLSDGPGAGESNMAFVAMWFHDETHTAWTDAIQPSIQAAGYDPVRIDKKHHNNRIDDEIEAAIRRAKFLVADFTGQRGGVYYEAGLAKGQGKQVVWLCRDDHFKDVHFDNRHYNFIRWKSDELDVLKTDLQNRIEATLGRGTYLLPALP
jgi:hypothetical protein